MTDLNALREKAMIKTKEKLNMSLTKDQLIIQAKNSINELHKISNTMSKRLREWAGGWVPEIEHDIDDHETFVTELIDAKRNEYSVGTEITEEDKEIIKINAQKTKEIFELKKKVSDYLEEELKKIAPNLLTICGASITGDLLIEARSLKRLSTLPSGTIQLLGAETALFRHLKNKKNKPPKHGLIFNHPLIQQARKKDRGKIARSLANKISICAKVDYFKGEPIGEKLKEKLEKKFNNNYKNNN